MDWDFDLDNGIGEDDPDEYRGRNRGRRGRRAETRRRFAVGDIPDLIKPLVSVVKKQRSRPWPVFY